MIISWFSCMLIMSKSVQAVVHWRPCFRQEQRRLPQLDLHLQRMTFINWSGAAGRRVFTSSDITKFGIQLLIRMYGGFEFEILDIMRYRKFASKVVSNSVSFLQVQTLPPTTAAADQHCKRTFRPCFRQEQRRLPQLDLHLQRMTFINWSGAAGRRVFTGTNLPFDIVHPQSIYLKCLILIHMS
jgi:hypothetical protein